MDRISNLPSCIIETVLCLLPIQEAARTSILSTGWRYRWIKIPKLVFDENKFKVSSVGAEPSVLDQTFDEPSQRKEMTNRCKLFYAIYQVLLMHEGPLHEFTLRMEVDDSCVEVDHIILHLLKKNTVKKLKLDFLAGDMGFRSPISLFSLHKLTDLYLCDCALFHERSPFKEFRCLTTLYLERINTYEHTLLRFLSSCPLLKRLTLNTGSSTIIETQDIPIPELFKCLPLIEYLLVSFFIVECFGPKRLPKVLPTLLVHLKHLCMKHLCFRHIYGLPFLVLLLRSSPNLEKLKLVMHPESSLDEEDLGSFKLEDYSDFMLEHLNELEIVDYSDAENELDFLKLILANSPALKRVNIFPCCVFDEDDVSETSEALLDYPSASPMVKITCYLSNSN
ncbi:hypothetical protein SSX86_000664 [Deinandra increscens subsp. villosa]|uniref:FBD domain-containing protein n=1 Tax=Deinandra increscens subsp. villosa TaxID=3103831 RepID=A0AAP0DTF4_9ASTR